MKMYDYVASAGGRAKMLAMEAPQFSWASPPTPSSMSTIMSGWSQD